MIQNQTVVMAKRAAKIASGQKNDRRHLPGPIQKRAFNKALYINLDTLGHLFPSKNKKPSSNGSPNPSHPMGPAKLSCSGLKNHFFAISEKMIFGAARGSPI